jgi:hypothetical protein
MKFSKRGITAGVASAATLAAGISGVALVGSAGAATTEHTYTFTAVDEGSGVSLGKRDFAQQQNDVKNGKVIGYDILSGTYHPVTKKVTLHLAITRKGGLLYLSERAGNTLKTHGIVTGGSGTFKGVTGTFSTSQKSANSKRVNVVVKVRN